MFRRFSIIAMAAAVFVLASCAKENLIGNGLKNDGLLKFGLSMSGSPTNVIETKASSMATEDGSFTLPLNYERCDGIESTMAGPETKGTQYNSAEEYTGAGNTTFSVVAWNGDGTPFFENATEVKYDSGRWSTQTAYQWDPKGDVKTFLAWANAPATGAVIGNALLEGEGRQTFSYTVPADARQQNDIMLGWYKGNGGDSMTADITMVHPLTAIVFKKGEMDLSVSAIKSISIEGLLKTGEAEVTYAIVSEQVKPSYSWTMGSETQKVTLSPKDETPAVEVDETTRKIGVPFIVLPQKVAANKVKLSVVLTIGGTDRTLTAYIPAMDLKEGQTNVFTIGYKLPYDDGSLPGEFSVSPTKKVRFSPGNLYYDGNNSIFVFEANQYDYRTYYYNGQAIGSNNAVINGQLTSTAYSDWGLLCWSTENDNWGLIDPTIDGSLTAGNFVDWGTRPEFQNTWRTLSNSEYEYLLSHNKNGLATIDTGNTSVSGTVIVPEGWTAPSGCSLVEGSGDGFNTNQYSLSDWQKMHINGAVFFPAVGYYYDVLHYNNERGLYWSSTPTTAAGACYMNVESYGTIAASHERTYRCSVRLVTDVDKPQPSKVKFIDLGLPSGTLWANMNIGATSETEIGDYFAWGETEARGADWATSKPYTWANAPFNDGSSSYNSTYFTANKSNWLDGNTLKPEYDAAHVAYGGDATMPTSVQIQELIDNTDISCIENTGLGYYLWKLTNKRDESKFIYLPCGGWRYESTIEGGGSYAQIWSSTLYNGDWGNANDIRLQGSTRTVSDMGRCIGMPVRAVKSPAPKPDVLPGEFSVSATKRVKFSKGNLWADKSSGQAVWHFEDNQYDYRSIGEASEYDKPAVIHGIRTITPSGYWGLFGFSSTNVNAPYGISTDYETNESYLGDFVDWGTALDVIGTWRTLSGGPTGEWYYILCERQTEVQGIASENPRFFFGSVHNGVTTVNGIYVFPDKFSWPDGLNKPQNINVVGDFSTNDYSSSVFNTLENAGMVFLPAVGARNGFAVFENEKRCQYWSSTPSSNTEKAFELLGVWFPGNYTIFDASGENERHGGYSVRLVTDFQSSASTIEVTGEVRTNYNVTNGPKEYKVKSGSPWKLQYTLDDGTNWVDAKAGQTIDGWISFDKVSGIASDQEVSVKATVAPAASPTSITVNHNDNLRNASYKGQNSEVASQQRPYDLSTHDIYGNPTQRNTANCYVISGPGLYAFPLVYGNAIKNGADNKQAYAPTAATNGTTYLTPFKGAVDDPVKSPDCNIISPYIPDVATAAPLWEDVVGWALVGENDCKVLSPSQAAAKGLTAGCGYVMFEVKAANLTPGNAVIAVKNSGGTILWSWHLWVTDLDLACMTVTNHDGSFNKGMMPINLGWVDADASATYDGYAGKSLQVRFYVSNDNIINKVAERKPSDSQLHNNGSSPLWQWGRKDPFIKNNYQTMSGPLAVNSGIKNPSSFIYSSTSISWLDKDYYNLWNAILTSKGDLGVSPVKTIYDPCPPGFKVPQGNVFTGFTSAGVNSESFAEWNVLSSETDVEVVPGHHFYTTGWKTGQTIFFPVNYWITPNTGEFVETKIINVWTSAISTGMNESYYFSAKKGSPNTISPIDNNGRANGGAVRPVEE